MTPPTSAAEAARLAYLTNAVMTASPAKLVVLLYDGALQSLAQAEGALRSGNRTVAGTKLGKALAIVGELRASLDLEQGGEIGRHLFALYGFATDRIIKANVEQDATWVVEARTVLAKLKEGWDGIVRAG